MVLSKSLSPWKWIPFIIALSQQRNLHKSTTRNVVSAFSTSQSFSTPTPTTLFTNNGGNPNCDTISPFIPNSNSGSYASFFDQLLLDEYQEIAQELKDRRKTWSRKRLEQSGITIYDASAEPESELMGDKIVRIVKHSEFSNLVIWKDKFTRGDVLILTPEAQILGNLQIDPIPRECLVVDVGADWLTVGVGPAWPNGLWEMRKHPGMYTVRVDRAAPQGPLKAQRKCLAEVAKGRKYSGDVANLLAGLWQNKNNNDPQQSNKAKKRMIKGWKEYAKQPPNFWIDTKTTDKEKTIDINDSTIGRLQKALHRAKQKSLFTPNESQEEAIINALSRRLSLIRGPPGTGKTKTAALLVSTALHLQQNTKDKIINDDHFKPRILAVTHSNGAADVLLESLLQMNVPAIRLGRPATVSPKVQHRTVVAMVEKLPQIQELRQTISNSDLDPQVRTAAAMDLRLAIQDAQHYMKMQAPVVVTTCIGAWQLLQSKNDKYEQSNSDLENEHGFPLVVLDEAAQTTEPALLCALVAAKAQQVVLVGDTRQLPPTVTSQNVDIRNGLSLSPMARLEQIGIPEMTLKVQYRMPADLLEFPSNYFYNGLVKCCETDEDGVGADSINQHDSEEEDDSGVQMKAYPPLGFPWPLKRNLIDNDNSSSHFCFVQVGDGDTELAHNFGGRSNPTEATLITRIVFDLLSTNDIIDDDIAIITPYSKQVQLIRNEILLQSQTMGSVNDSNNLDSTIQRRRLPNIKVGTVDSYQGQEVDLVLFSAVRSNSMHELGFLRDARRLCVAITRSKRGLIIAGDKYTLKSCKHWKSLLDFYEEKGCILDATDLEIKAGNGESDAAIEEDNYDDIFDDILDSVSLDDVMDVGKDMSNLLNKEEPLYGLFSAEDL